MASVTVENYLKQIYLLQQRERGHRVAMGALATAMQVVPGTATSMIKALADSGLVAYEPRGGVKLTRGGEQLALRVLRRHRLVELFLVNVLGFDWAEVHAEAEELEHAISDKVIEAIDRLLGHPEVDPHGDPIPTPTGAVASAPALSLLDAPPGPPLVVSRILDQSAEFLRLLKRENLTPGKTLEILGQDSVAGSVTLRTARRQTLTIGQSAAARILVAETSSTGKKKTAERKAPRSSSKRVRPT